MRLFNARIACRVDSRTLHKQHRFACRVCHYDGSFALRNHKELFDFVFKKSSPPLARIPFGDNQRDYYERYLRAFALWFDLGNRHLVVAPVGFRQAFLLRGLLENKRSTTVFALNCKKIFSSRAKKRRYARLLNVCRIINAIVFVACRATKTNFFINEVIE